MALYYNDTHIIDFTYNNRAISVLNVNNVDFPIGVESYDGLEFTPLGDGTYSVSAIDKNISGDIIIPSMYNGKPVTTIANKAFESCRSLTSITIPDSVTTIGDDAFYFCYGLTNITVDENNKNYKSINGNLYSKDGKTLIQYAQGKNNTTFEISDSVTTIGNYAFCYCPKLAKVVIPDSVTTIGNYAFYFCPKLTKVVIPDSVTTIGNYAFESCRSLTSVTIGNRVTTIGSYAFSECLNLASVVIPDSVTSIGSFTFFYCSKMVSVVIGNRVTSIGSSAFSSCDSLTSVYYNGTESDWAKITMGVNNTILVNATKYYYSEDQPEDEGNYWHYDENGEIGIWEKPNPNLTFILLDDGTYSVRPKEALSGVVEIPSTYNDKAVTKIADYGFEGCVDLTGVKLPDSITTIGWGAFKYCSMLATVDIGANSQLTTIESEAFYECTEITTLNLPDTLETIGDEVFALSSIETLTIPDNVTSIGSECFYDSCLTTIIFGANSKLSYIQDYTFENCQRLKTIAIPDGVIWIGERAFADCSNLTTVTFGANSKLDSIMDRAFTNCGLVSITIPDGCRAIYDGGFSQCANLETINLPSDIHIGEESAESVFHNTAYYNNPSNWVDGVLYIGEHLVTVDKTATEVVVASSCTSVSVGAISGWTHMAAVKIPLTVKNIPPLAFKNSEYLTVYCEAETKPEGWADDWCDDTVEVVWGYTDCYNGHTWSDWQETKPATCTTDGEEQRTCTVCVHTETKVIEATGHKYSSVVTAPTCTEQGYTEHTCDRCDNTYKDNYTDALGHTWGDWTIPHPPECEITGMKERKCTVCDAVETEIIPALGHTPSDWIIDKEATVETEGSKHKECTRCGVILETTSIPKLEDPNTYLVTENGEFLTDEQGKLLII